MLQVQVENVLAIHSCSKRSGMTGYRSGFVAGDADLVAQVKRMRSPPRAWPRPTSCRRRRWRPGATTPTWPSGARSSGGSATGWSAFFAEHGLSVQGSEATLYLWVKVPEGHTSATYASRLLDEAIVVSPGTAFGAAGEGFVRVSLVPTLQDIEEAIERWRTVR